MLFFPQKKLPERERERRISSCLSRKISELGDLGSLKKLQLFCGVGGTVTACHYDAWPLWPRARWEEAGECGSGGFEDGENDHKYP